jgi:hypothetical protein
MYLPLLPSMKKFSLLAYTSWEHNTDPSHRRCHHLGTRTASHTWNTWQLRGPKAPIWEQRFLRSMAARHQPAEHRVRRAVIRDCAAALGRAPASGEFGPMLFKEVRNLLRLISRYHMRLWIWRRMRRVVSACSELGDGEDIWSEHNTGSGGLWQEDNY